MSALKQPLTQKKLTNISIVRVKANGKRFEIACYKNKVLNWREGIEKDLNEVIQIDTIFVNVEQGIEAKKQDLQKAFDTTDRKEICRKILKTGMLQVSDKEREVHVESLMRDIVQLVVERVVHPQTGRQLTALTVENALKTIGFSVKSEDNSAKKQSLKAISELCAKLPDSFSRAKMRLSIVFPTDLTDDIKSDISKASGANIEDHSVGVDGAPSAITFVCDPSCYREFDKLATETHKGKGVSLQLVTSAVLAPVTAPTSATAPDSQPPAGSEAVAGSSVSADRRPDVEQRVEARAAPRADEAPSKKGMRCSACAAEFQDASEYRNHCRSKWHNYNLKRKVKGLSPVDEEEFFEIGLDISEGFLAVES